MKPKQVEALPEALPTVSNPDLIHNRPRASPRSINKTNEPTPIGLMYFISLQKLSSSTSLMAMGALSKGILNSI